MERRPSERAAARSPRGSTVASALRTTSPRRSAVPQSVPCTALSVPSWSRSIPEVAANSSSPGSADSSSWTAAPPARTSARARSTQSSSSSDGCAGAQAISSIASSAATCLDAAGSTAGRCWSLVTVAFRLDPVRSVPPGRQDGTGRRGLDSGTCGQVDGMTGHPPSPCGRRRARRDRRGRSAPAAARCSDRPGRRRRAGTTSSPVRGQDVLAGAPAPRSGRSATDAGPATPAGPATEPARSRDRGGRRSGDGRRNG